MCRWHVDYQIFGPAPILTSCCRRTLQKRRSLPLSTALRSARSRPPSRRSWVTTLYYKREDESKACCSRSRSSRLKSPHARVRTWCPYLCQTCPESWTTGGVWDLYHHLDGPYQKRNLWQPSKKVYRNQCSLCCVLIKARAKTTRYS